jgi:hypothetical protein
VKRKTVRSCVLKQQLVRLEQRWAVWWFTVVRKKFDKQELVGEDSDNLWWNWRGELEHTSQIECKFENRFMILHPWTVGNRVQCFFHVWRLVPSCAVCVLKVWILNSMVFVFIALHLLSCVCAEDCECENVTEPETITFVMAWRQKRGRRRDSGSMKWMGQHGGRMNVMTKQHEER